MSEYRIVFGKPYYNVWNIQQECWWGWRTIGWSSTKQEAKLIVEELLS